MVIKYGSVADGITDISKYLGLEPSKVIYMHSTVFDEDDLDRASFIRGGMLYAEILSFLSKNKDGSYAVCCYYNDDLLNYLDNQEIITKDNVVFVNDDNRINYPYNSPSVMLNLKLKFDEELRNKLNGFTIVSSFVSKYDVDSANLINGNLLMPLEENSKYTSKYWFRKLAKRDNFSVLPGYYFKGIKELNDNLNNMIEYDGSKIWLKLEGQASGKGNIAIDKIDYDEIREKLEKLTESIYNYDYVYNDLPLIIERNASFGSEKEIMNIGVEAVISEEDITILGGVAQKTNDAGNYLGSFYNEEVEKYLDYAIDACKDAFNSYAKEGYRGFLTIDVLVTLDDVTDEIRAYCIDPNARFSAGFMLLKSIHMAEKITNDKVYGLSFTFSVPGGGDIVKNILKCAGKNLYNKDRGVGLIPALLNDISVMSNGLYYLKVISVASTYGTAVEMFEEFKTNIRNIDK